MERRKFIQASIVAISTPILVNGSKKSELNQINDPIKGFIFSDAHIGWKGKDQPSLLAQKAAISTISNYFNDLDLVFDTGDIHHGNLKEQQRIQAREFWLKEMAGKFPASLFHYIPGNHELGSGLHDAELTCSQLGSFTFRPYYSFDYKGIHFISLPQLQDTILISQETLNWLKIDLEQNQDKTTLIFSHNSIAATTFNSDATGYRITVNSEEVLDMLNKHGNVIGWFHGHNHHYEIVKKHNRLYVSNGRIGGFNPPKSWGNFGQGHLGGIYFEIDSGGLKVKCFSATNNQFFDSFGQPQLSNEIQLKTSYDPQSSTNYYWGHGMLEGNNSFTYFNHYLSNNKSLVVVSNNNLTPINTNHDFRFDTTFQIEKGKYNKLIGYTVLPKEVDFKKLGKNKLLHFFYDKPFYLKFPIETYKFDKYLSRSGYYRCGLGSKYLLNIESLNLDDFDVSLQYKVMDLNHDVCYQTKEWNRGFRKETRQTFEIAVPTKLSKKPFDDKLYLFITIRLHGSQISLKSIKLLPNGSDIKGVKDQITFDENIIDIENKVQALKLNKNSGKIRVTNAVNPKTLYVKNSQIDWQVRNATATLTETGLYIDNPRNHTNTYNQVIITPTNNKPFYINQLENITACKISYSSNKIVLNVKNKGDNATVILVANERPVKTTGVTFLNLSKKLSFYRVNSDMAVFYF